MKWNHGWFRSGAILTRTLLISNVKDFEQVFMQGQLLWAHLVNSSDHRGTGSVSRAWSNTLYFGVKIYYKCRYLLQFLSGNVVMQLRWGYSRYVHWSFLIVMEKTKMINRNQKHCKNKTGPVFGTHVTKLAYFQLLGLTKCSSRVHQ